jgi:hypothetical protein
LVLAYVGIAVGVGVSIVLYLLPPRERLATPTKVILAATAELTLVYGIAAVVFWWATTMSLSFWPSVIVSGLLAAFATGVAWKHIDSLPRAAEAQPPKTESPKTPVAPSPPLSAPPAKLNMPQPGTTVNAPGSILNFGGTVTNPTIHNYAAPRVWALDAQYADLLAKRLVRYAPGRSNSQLIEAVWQDHDAALMARSLAAAFRGARWAGVDGPGFGSTMFSGDIKGLVFKLHSADSKPTGLKEVIETLLEAGIQPPFGKIVSPEIPADEFTIIVGRKPE